MNATHLAEELAALGAQVVGESVNVVLGPKGCPWSWNWSTRTITIRPDDLNAHAADISRGVLLHECAHAAITRVGSLVERHHLQLYMDLLNVMEDLRIEKWLVVRMSGTAPWLETANTVLCSKMRKSPWRPGYQIQYLRAILEERGFGNLSPGCSEIVRAVIEETREAVDTIRDAIPKSARGRGAVREILRSQQAMLSVFFAKVIPVWERLVAADLAEGRPRHTCGPHGRTPFPWGSGGPQDVLGLTGGRKPHAESYSERAIALTPQIEHLTNEFLHLFQTEGRIRERRGMASGHRIDLQACMQFEADQRLHDKLWVKRLYPDRFDPCVILLLDTSDSMEGDRFVGAFDGTVLLTEVCLRAGIPFAVWAFSNKVQEVIPPGTFSGAWPRARVDSLRWRLGGATRLQPALKAAHTSMASTFFRNPMVIVFSDGLPDNTGATIAEIRKMESRGIPCVGLGLGAESQNLKNLFSYSLTGIEAKDAPTQIANVLREAILYRKKSKIPLFGDSSKI